MTSSSESRALDQLLQEARCEKRPDVDWEHLEESLFDRIQREPRSTARRRWPLGLTLGAVAAAAAAAILASRSGPELESPRPPQETAERGNVQGVPSSRGAQVGDVLTAKASAVAFEQPGLARWEVEPNGRVRVLETGPRVILQLERGAVLAHVSPSLQAESFAIIVGDTRVAVHGTVFRVERRESEAWVDVREGTVSVGRSAGKDRNRVLLQAPASERFTLDGRRVEDARPGPPAPVAAAPVTSEPGPANAKRLPDEPSIDDVEQGVELVVAGLRTCFAEHTAQSGGVQVVVRTTMSFVVTPDGGIRPGVAFAPPLAPAVQQCGDRRMREVRFPASSRGTPVTRSIELRR